MAIVATPKFHMPPYHWPTTGGFTVSTGSNMDASGDKYAFVIQCPKAGTLDKFEFRLATVGNTPDNGIRLSFQSIDMATGFPDGTQSQYRDITSGLTANTWQAPGLMTSDGTDGGVKRTVAAGDIIGCVIEYVTFVASDSFALSVLDSASTSIVNQYLLNGSTGTYVKGNVGLPLLALKYSDGSYAEFDIPIWPVMAREINTFNSSSTPDEIGLKITFPMGVRTVGVWLGGDLDNASQAVLYDASSSVIDSFTFDPDLRTVTNHAPNFAYWPAGPHTLTASTVYRLILKPTTTSGVIMSVLQLAGAAYQACLPGGTGSTLIYTTRTDAGAWTDDSTRRPMIGLICDGVDSGGGSGGVNRAALASGLSSLG